MARIGKNPVKNSTPRLTYKQHRVIIPFYIPNVNEEYFSDMVEVFKQCLESLILTINSNTTCITLINNASCKEASDVAELYVKKGVIDRYIVFSENRGKVEPCLLEAHASLEDYITISDADMLFYGGWESAVFEIFNNIERAGAVSLITNPNLAFHFNTSVMIRHFFSNKTLTLVNSGVDKLSLDEFAFSTGNNPQLFYQNNKDGFSWYDKQFILKENNVEACLGAGHCCTTYKRFLLDGKPKKKVGIVFADGLEFEYIDKPIDLFGYYRLSTIKSYAYHLGNKPEKNRNNHNAVVSCNYEIKNVTQKRYFVYFIPYRLRNVIAKLFRLVLRKKLRRC